MEHSQHYNNAFCHKWYYFCPAILCECQEPLWPPRPLAVANSAHAWLESTLSSSTSPHTKCDWVQQLIDTRCCYCYQFSNGFVLPCSNRWYLLRPITITVRLKRNSNYRKAVWLIYWLIILVHLLTGPMNVAQVAKITKMNHRFNPWRLSAEYENTLMFSRVFDFKTVSVKPIQY